MVRKFISPDQEELNANNSRHQFFQQYPDNLFPIDAQYEVDEVLDVKYRGKATQYLVRWAAPYNDPQYDTWEKKKDLNCDLAMKDFHRAKDNKRKQDKNKQKGALSMRERISRMEGGEKPKKN